jgi:hypothetical protein
MSLNQRTAHRQVADDAYPFDFFSSRIPAGELHVHVDVESEGPRLSSSALGLIIHTVSLVAHACSPHGRIGGHAACNPHVQ